MSHDRHTSLVKVQALSKPSPHLTFIQIQDSAFIGPLAADNEAPCWAPLS